LVRNALKTESSKLSPAQAKIVLIATSPGHFRDAIKEILIPELSQIIELKNINHTNFIHQFPEPRDDGYLLFSGYERAQKNQRSS